MCAFWLRNLIHVETPHKQKTNHTVVNENPPKINDMEHLTIYIHSWFWQEKKCVLQWDIKRWLEDLQKDQRVEPRSHVNTGWALKLTCNFKFTMGERKNSPLSKLTIEIGYIRELCVWLGDNASSDKVQEQLKKTLNISQWPPNAHIHTDTHTHMHTPTQTQTYLCLTTPSWVFFFVFPIVFFYS